MSSRFNKGKIFTSTIILLFCTLLSGCAFKDIDKRTFIVGIGIDPSEKEDKKFKVTLKIALPIGSIKQSTSPSYTYLSHDGDSISEAIRIIETHVDKALEFGQTKIIAIHEDLLINDYQSFMDYFIRRGDIQLVAWVGAASPTAEEILKVEPSTEVASSIALFNIFDGNGTDSPFITTTPLFEFRRNYFTKGIDAVIPLLETNEEQSELIVNKSVILKKNSPPFKLSPTETLYFNSLFHHSSGYSFKVKEEDFIMLLNVQKMKMKYKIHTEEGKTPLVNININVVGTVLESSKPLSISKLDEYNKTTAKVMKKTTEDLLKKAQEEDLDPFGFGLRYRATRINDKNTISDWEAIYPDLEFKVVFKVDLQSIGAIQ
ncbi:Ger(x)C family spore germination protein [Sporosarcina siberiensis]|uniref:Ger(X)C family spore germination protein n=1 Tax=Sporosarcina siberiensis TaxID=1365606 RepID=A0ABW4SEJ9_9BACL